MPRLRSFEPERDFDDVYSLWQSVLPQWVLPADLFRLVLFANRRYVDGDHIVAEEHGRLAGFVATQRDPSGDGHFMAILVAPDRRRRGIGTLLHATALDRITRRGARRAQLGGGDPRLWPGAPADLAGGVSFFEAQGWTWDHSVADMIRDVRDFTMPEAARESALQRELRFAILSHEHVPELLAFEQREFPAWAEGFREAIELGDTDDVLVARGANGTIAGALLLYTARSHPRRTDVLWREALGADVGALGGVGVAAATRGRGIGTALVARGTEILGERGVRSGFLGWVWAVDFYRRLGYAPWQTYTMSSRTL